VTPTQGLLDGLAVVDLLPPAFGMTGRILADLGALVVRAGWSASTVRVDPRWTAGAWTWDLGKSVVDVDADQLARLVADSDMVLRLEEPGAAAAVAGAAVLDVVLSPFGAVGPRAGWTASDLGVAAASGNLWATGDPDRPPVRCSAPLSLAHAGSEAAFAALSALRAGTRGRVDVSMAEAFTVACLGAPAGAGVHGDRGARTGAVMGGTKEIWPCADGWVSFGLRGGAARQPSLERLAALAAERGDERLVGVDWARYSPATAAPDLVATLTEAMGALFASMTVAELDALATEEQVLVAPVLDAAGVTASAQLAARHFFLRPEGRPEVPGSFAAARPPGGDWRRLVPVGPAVAGGAPAGPEATEAGAWAGTTIVEFGAGVAGPLVGRYFAEQGATVVRVESATRPDFLRVYALGPKNPHGLEGSSLFVWTNAGKLGVTLDLKQDEARRLARRLVGSADAVIENFTPGALDRLDLGYDELAAAHPRLVVLSMSFHGQTGPRRTEAGFGALGSALSGFDHLTGWPDREPIGPASTITDSLAPRFGAALLAAALLRQRATGAGAHLDVGQLEATVYALSPWLAWCAEHGDWGREGNRSPVAVPHGLYPGRGDDRWLAVAVWTDDEWAVLADAIGWSGPPLATLAERQAAADEIEAALRLWTGSRDPDDAAAVLQAVGVEAVPVADYCDVARDETLRTRGHFVPTDHAVLGSVLAERGAYRLDADRGGYPRASPELGRDNRRVFVDLLGLTVDEFERLGRDGALA